MEGDGRHVDDLLCTRHQAEVTLLKPSSAKTYAMVQPDHGCAYYLCFKADEIHHHVVSHHTTALQMSGSPEDGVSAGTDSNSPCGCPWVY